MSNERIFLYAGNWRASSSSWATPKPSGCGFGIFEFFPQLGELKFINSFLEDISVGATYLDTRRNILYCVNEVMTYPGSHLGGGGQVYALAIDPQSGKLKEINHQPSYGSLPSLVTVDGSGKYLLVTNHSGRTPITKSTRDEEGKFHIKLEYDEASTVLYALNTDGSIGDPLDIYRHCGSGPLPLQSHSQLHSVMVSPSGELFAVCDKGGDEIVFFRIDHALRRLQVCAGGHHSSMPGSSPRYSAFHPTKPCFYANHETAPMISMFRYDSSGRLSLIGTIDVLPAGIQSDSKIRQSDIRIHPSGKYLYGLTRGLNAVSVFVIDQEIGALQMIQNVTLDGAGPRGCAISPDGRFMAVAALESKEVLVWSIAEDGRLAPTGRKVTQPSPGNVTFFTSILR